MACERFFLPDEGDPELPVSYESGCSLAELPVIALSVAYELELAGLVTLFDRAGIPRSRLHRDHRHPFILAGGPLTFSNPLPLAPFVDAIIMGEADTLAIDVLRVLRSAPTRAAALDALAATSPARFRPVAPRIGAAHRRAVRRRAAARVGPHPRARGRAHGDASDRDRARLLARLHVLRDAALHERRACAWCRSSASSPSSPRTPSASASAR